MTFWTEKHRPSDLAKVDYHRDVSERMKRLISYGDFPHLLVHGPQGAGKRTRIHCILQELYGPGSSRVRIETATFVAPSGKKFEISLLCSNYHVMLSPSDVGIYDRVVVQELIKKMAQTQQLESSVQRQFKVIVLLQVDRLTREAQQALRRTMEKYSASCRLILSSQSCSRIIPAIQSRCLPIRIPAPEDKEIVDVLCSIAKRENQAISTELAKSIAEKSGGNLRTAILFLEAYCVHRHSKNVENVLMLPDWMIYIKETANRILLEQSSSVLLEVRGRFYTLLTQCIPPSLIFKRLYFELYPACDPSIKSDVTKAAAEYEYELILGSKAIYHLEAFAAEFMSIYKNFMEKATRGLL